MKDPETANNPLTGMKVSSSVLDAFDLLKAPGDDGKLTGGSKIISQLQGSEVSFFIYFKLNVEAYFAL